MANHPSANLENPEVCDACACNCNISLFDLFDQNALFPGGTADTASASGLAFFINPIVSPKAVLDSNQCVLPAGDAQRACIYAPPFVTGELLSYGDAGTLGNVSDPVVVGFGGWSDFKFFFWGPERGRGGPHLRRGCLASSVLGTESPILLQCVDCARITRHSEKAATQRQKGSVTRNAAAYFGTSAPSGSSKMLQWPRTHKRLLSDAPVVESDQDNPGVILDYDGDGNVAGLEILSVSKGMPNPMSVEYASTPPLRRPA